jgi:predicted nucleic acid-binding protein
VKSSKSYVIDTNVTLAYIVENAPDRDKVVEIFNVAKEDKIKPCVVYPALSGNTVRNVQNSIAGFAEHDRMAIDLVLWIKNVAEVVEITLNIALRAGELKKLLGIALTDCYVIATAEALSVTALFLKIKEEMKKRIHLIEKLYNFSSYLNLTILRGECFYLLVFYSTPMTSRSALNGSAH